MNTAEDINRRVLIIDDNPAIHEDFRKVLADSRQETAELDRMESALFGELEAPLERIVFEIDSASQGHEGVARAASALSSGKPYALVFVDLRMPPGWDGIETIERLWEVDPSVQVVICSAYSDYSGDEIRKRLGSNDGFLILKKPFDSVEVTQLAHTLTRKWSLQRSERRRADELEALVEARTAQLHKVETELRLAQKLEAIGQLAAGIAHEINTPAQYVGDQVHFLRSAFGDLGSLINAQRAMMPTLDPREIEALEEQFDLEYVTRQVPASFASAIEGLDRIRRIVQAMKEFGHSDNGMRSPIDVNRALMTTLEVARGEYKYVADLETEFAELPEVSCVGSEMNQVFLNLIVNAGHAIADVVGESGAMGTLRIETRHVGDNVVVSVKDTGCGIPDAIRDRVFDPFFTTKELGRGTGQGLAIARRVVEKHRGKLTFESAVGKGTTFVVHMPIRSLEPPR